MCLFEKKKEKNVTYDQKRINTVPPQLWIHTGRDIGKYRMGTGGESRMMRGSS